MTRIPTTTTGRAGLDDPTLDEIERLCRRLRMPYLRTTAAEVLATAKAQRWDPTEVVRILLDEEARGRDHATTEIPSGYDELMPRTIATALVDRLMHHAHVLVTTGDSVRLTDAAGGKGVKPLT